MRKTGFHHVAFACKDLDATVQFYEELMGFPLIHTEVGGVPDHFLRHIFFDLGDGSSLAFFQLNNVGEPEDYKTDISTGMGLPVWVNHVAFSADQARYDDVKKKMEAAGVPMVMEEDHGWCQSVYYTDPNGIMVEFCMDTPGFEPDNAKAKSMLTATPSA